MGFTIAVIAGIILLDRNTVRHSRASTHFSPQIDLDRRISNVARTALFGLR